VNQGVISVRKLVILMMEIGGCEFGTDVFWILG